MKNRRFVSNTKPLVLALITLTVSGMVAVSIAAPDNDSGQASEAGNSWLIDSDESWNQSIAQKQGLEIKGGQATPTQAEATLTSVLKRYDTKRSAKSIRLDQSTQWLNWEPAGNIGPVNLGDAPVFLSLGPDNYWMFGRYQERENKGRGKNKAAQTPLPEFTSEPATLDDFDIPLATTRFRNQFDAPGGLKEKLGGYHAWQSKDMVNWVHHGAITKLESKWMTTAEYADGKAYFYYDFPNDQDPHVYVDSDLFDGIPGENMGMAYEDPSHGSDCAIIRDLDGKFHLILEDWSPINARKHAWDSPLAAHAISPDGVKDFKALAPPVDERTTATGEVKTYKHPHWVKENPERFKTNVAEYAVHKPDQNAYGDWAAIAIGGQYYLFCDFDPATKQPVDPTDRKELTPAEKQKKMSVGWFTSSSIDTPFEWCGNIGQGHPDPDIMFAEGKFYLATQQPQDFVSPGPWVQDVQVRVGVDIDNDQSIDQWTDWTSVKESYDYIPGFSKQIKRTPARLDLSTLPSGHGFQFELKISNTSGNAAKPIIDSVHLHF